MGLREVPRNLVISLLAEMLRLAAQQLPWLAECLVVHQTSPEAKAAGRCGTNHGIPTLSELLRSCGMISWEITSVFSSEKGWVLAASNWSNGVKSHINTNEFHEKKTRTVVGRIIPTIPSPCSAYCIYIIIHIHMHTPLSCKWSQKNGIFGFKL